MAVEPRRGCGFRKIGGLYLVSGGVGVVCDRLPIPLEVCPTCGHGIKQTRGFTWVNAAELVGGVHPQCADEFACPLCMAPHELGRCGLLWIGEQFYKTPADFDREAAELGVSRRISAIPRGFKVGETWILFAHPKAVLSYVEVESDNPLVAVLESERLLFLEKRRVFKPGIFKVWRPARIEKILPESLRGSAEAADLAAVGITPVFVPDDDPDHRGTVYADVQRLALEEDEQA
jgi:hypothetical protein